MQLIVCGRDIRRRTLNVKVGLAYRDETFNAMLNKSCWSSLFYIHYYAVTELPLKFGCGESQSLVISKSILITHRIKLSFCTKKKTVDRQTTV